MYSGSGLDISWGQRPLCSFFYSPQFAPCRARSAYIFTKCLLSERTEAQGKWLLAHGHAKGLGPQISDLFPAQSHYLDLLLLHFPKVTEKRTNTRFEMCCSSFQKIPPTQTWPPKHTSENIWNSHTTWREHRAQRPKTQAHHPRAVRSWACWSGKT